MDSSYKKELQGVFEGKGFSLPQLFVRGEHIGGADEIKRLHEEGKLFDLMKGFPVMDPGFVCRNCGVVRFVP
ncbi:putative glutaredoxin, Thioredoxin-like superfamily [Helianthus annuus]|uniref:Glutaredoxin, Thioredoxin-like superfamily n=2 Tax=Helianthus annuus TaxID=4232 RepID=A0A9K3HA36_HELAN|nr:putative glutaredoxin, Thioredoxin-like superfamily [Helianthus annuus]KAJ0476159.1 putative Thioredoxin-like superfamily [Helianthus annuus]KAJ0480248.1 putative glutaredoxin, Thioredoxin-like superfamily [Helianthus annuus]KAJ0496966.1 putative Thioredoxin-like superfamily [Helianthus annuus]KAJ0662996.1 putative Thioredoxin-like superfamily [Helianthus annuus]